MEFKFNVTGERRKALVLAICEHCIAPMRYLGAPGFQYEVGGYTVDKAGTVIGEYDASLFAALSERGFVPEVSAEADLPDDERLEQEVTDNVQEEQANLPDRLTIEMPLDGFTPEKLENLAKLVNSKATLLSKAIGAEKLPILVTADKVAFSWFKAGTPVETDAYSRLVFGLCDAAKKQTRVLAQERDTGNDKFAMRCFLIRLGFVGPGYAAVRKTLLSGLSGDSAWRFGRPEKEVAHA